MDKIAEFEMIKGELSLSLKENKFLEVARHPSGNLHN